MYPLWILLSACLVSRSIKGFRCIQGIICQIYRSLNLNDISDFICRLNGLCYFANTGDKWNKIDHIVNKTSPNPWISRIRDHFTYADSQRENVKKSIPESAIRILSVSGIVVTIYKVVSVCERPDRYTDCFVSISNDESRKLRIVIPILRPVQSGFFIEDISTVPERVAIAQRISQSTSGSQQLAPCIVLVFYCKGSGIVKDADNIALAVVV